MTKLLFSTFLTTLFLSYGPTVAQDDYERTESLSDDPATEDLYRQLDPNPVAYTSGSNAADDTTIADVYREIDAETALYEAEKTMADDSAAGELGANLETDTRVKTIDMVPIEPDSPPSIGDGNELSEDDISLFKAPGGEEGATSIRQSLESAYMQSSQLDAARAEQRATDEDVAVAISGWRPSASVGFRQTQSSQRTSGKQASTNPGIPALGIPPTTTVSNRPNSHNHNTAFTLSGQQNVFQGGGTYAQTEAAKERVYAGRSGLTNTEQSVLVETVQSFLTVISSEAIAELRKSSENFLNKTWEQARVRYEVGEVTRTEVEAAKASYLGARSDRIAAEGAVESARATYARVVGSPAGKLGKAEILADLPNNLDEAKEISLANNPAVKQAEHTIEASEYDVNTQIATLLPSVDLQAEVTRSEVGGTKSPGQLGTNRQTDAQFVTSVSMPLYNQGSSRARIRQAHQRVAQAKVNLVTAKRQTTEAVTRAWEDLQSARSQVESLIAQVQSSKLAVEGVTEEANVGTKNILDVLQQEQDLVDAQIKLVQAEQSLVLASYQVLAAVGRMTASELKLNVDLYNPEDYYDDHAGAFLQFWKGKDYRYVKDHDEDNEDIGRAEN